MLFTMKNGALFLLIILLLSLVFCSVLGGNCKKGFPSYNMQQREAFGERIREKTGISTSTENDENFNTDDSSLEISAPSSIFKNYDNYNHFDRSSVPTTFFGPNGSTANFRNENGEYSLLITNPNGTTTLYTTASLNSKNSNYNSGSSSYGSTSYGSTSSSSSSSYDSNINPSVTEKTFYSQNGGELSTLFSVFDI